MASGKTFSVSAQQWLVLNFIDKKFDIQPNDTFERLAITSRSVETIKEDKDTVFPKSTQTTPFSAPTSKDPFDVLYW